jgi:plasmid maintenance system antidote protein VapI
MTLQDVSMTERFGTRPLRDILERQERTPAWLARKTGRSASHVFRVVRGERPLSRQFAEDCARVLGVSVDDILPEDAA